MLLRETDGRILYFSYGQQKKKRDQKQQYSDIFQHILADNIKSLLLRDKYILSCPLSELSAEN